jgi:uncharacterized protein YbjT (DUF2867 family)
MEHILITGATGNVGQAILAHFRAGKNQKVYIASRNREANTDTELYFDFENIASCEESLKRTDILFLLRPPHISDTEKYFKPLIALAKKSNVKHIVFLSVQGADEVSYIPHAKIEKLIRESGIAYTFIPQATLCKT